ncbi:beta-lactamase family protein [Sandaracinobacter sp. RS1-74]|uniref:serine hydrolase domain-containing protein n=1 Tax=Sandaracinobacteroides sayramensis TaxID=2913411 RepID=UPI001EDAD50A|nr:serine hydrolase domain-containing protein [Sandaracinobacteroides sayramensis]MCG2841634.1 beta-lactamase family protein [Sandaracinobacteroides sayramensis]
MGAGGAQSAEAGLMLDRRRLLAGIVAAAGTGAAPAFGRGSPYPAVQALIEAYVAEGLVPGAIVGVLKPGGFRPTWMATGRTQFEGGAPVTPATIWRIFSMTKQVTGVAALQQVADGKLTIDTPIAEIMPEFGRMRVLTDPEKGLDSRPAEKPILLRHLLTHTAGFTYSFTGNGPLQKEYKRLGLQPMSAGALLGPGDTPAPDLKTYMERLATLPLLAEPGTLYHYSISLDVAGALLERLTGKTLDRIFAGQLLQPLGMRDTGFWLTGAQQKRLSGLYAWRNPANWALLEKPVLIDSAAKTELSARPAMLAGGAGLASSAEDFARFLQMMLNEGLFEGKMLLPRGMARLAMSNLMEPGVFYAETEGYGAGGRSVLFETSARNPEHYSVDTWGWGGAASTLCHVDPIRQQAVVLMLQSLGNEKGPNEKRLNRALAADHARG